MVNLSGYNFPELKIIIGITGNGISSGKTLVGNLLTEVLCGNHSYSDNEILHTALGNWVKEELSDATGIPLDFFFDRDKKEYVRGLMQTWADAKKEAELYGYQEYWIERMLADTKQDFPKIKCLIISDIRYEYEADFIRNADCRNAIIHVETLNKEVIKHTDHHSENGIEYKPYDWTVYNIQDEGITSLTAKVEHLVETAQL